MTLPKGKTLAATGTLTLVVVLLVLCLSKFSRPDTADGSPAAMLSVDQGEWDFGVVRQEQVALSHAFKLTNDGPEAIRLTVSHLGCNCISADCPDVLAPHSNALVKVNLEIRDREGYFATRAHLATSDPAVPTIEFILRFYAQPKLHIDPPFFQLVDLAHGEVAEKEFRITKRLESDDDSGKRPEIILNHSGLTCHYVDSEIVQGPPGGFRRAIHRYRLQVDTTALPRLPRLNLEKAISLRWPGAPTGEEKWIALEATFRHHRSLNGQTALMLQAKDKDEKAQLSIWSRDGEPFSVAKLTSSIPELAVEAASKKPDKVHKILVSLARSSNLETAQARKGYIDIITDKYANEPFRVEVLVLP